MIQPDMDPGPDDALQKQMDSLQESIRKSQMALVDLKTRRNEAAHIYRLPVEILSMILRLREVDPWGVWLGQAHVSRYFYRVACDTPEFWTEINIHSRCPPSVSCIHEIVKRSRGRPMDIVAFIQTDRFDHGPYDDDEPDFLTDYAYDNRGPCATSALEAALNLGEPPSILDNSRADMTYVRSVDVRAPMAAWEQLVKRFSFNIPLLELLKLTIEKSDTRVMRPLDLSETVADYDLELIRTLELKGPFRMPNWIPYMDALVHLTIANDAVALDGDLLVDVLTKCENLETFELENFWLSDGDNGLNLANRAKHNIPMHCLRTMELKISFYNCAALLRCITFPESCSLKLGNATGFHGVDHITLFTQSMCAHLPHRYQFTEKGVEVSFGENPSTTSTIIFPARNSIGQQLEPEIIVGILLVTANANLHTIHISSPLQPFVRGDLLASALRDSPNVHELRVGFGTVSLFLDIMLNSRNVPPPTCPKLCDVHIEDVDFGISTILRDLERFLRRQQDSGQQLSKLSFHNCRLKESDLSELRGLVGELVWDGKYGMRDLHNLLYSY
ncbi:hypothetical protein C8J57DRAFT_270122 [Mycena rebaudengoi]|nr:hypothetical protein C8J57DRAFT_270122 [Mycena rebaudengoi]